MRDFNDLLFEVSLYNLNAANKKHSDIDLKALTIITICGLLLGFMIGDSFSKLHDEVQTNFILTIFFSISVFSLFLTIYLCTQAIHPRESKEMSTSSINKRAHEISISLEAGGLTNEVEERKIRMTIATIEKNEKKLQEICDCKAAQLLDATDAFIGSLFFIVVYAFLNFFIF
jgi:hypothetical protein